MDIKVAEKVPARNVEMDGAADVCMRMLIGPDDGARNFNMRMFELGPGGHTPLHRHAWEHEVYVLTGTGTLRTEDGNEAIAAGHCVLVPGEDLHQFANTGETTLRFLCLVPSDSA